MNRVLVIAAHPDDEVLGCGATLARHAAQGDEIHVVIMAEGVTSRGERRERNECHPELAALSSAAHRAGDLLGIRSLVLHDFADNRMDSVDMLDIVKVVEHHLEMVQPDLVYTHFSHDVNVDHRRIHDAVVTACRPLPGRTVSTLLFFEIPSSTEWRPPTAGQSFEPTWFVDTSLTLNLKLQALQVYEAEMRPWPHSRSLAAVEHLARWRGATVGVEAAEAFMVGRVIVK